MSLLICCCVVVLVLVVVFFLFVQVVCYEGQDFFDIVQFGGVMLQFNGVGKCQVVIYLFYFVVLYLLQKVMLFEVIYVEMGLKWLEMCIVILLIKDVLMQEFVKVIDKGVNCNCIEVEKVVVVDCVKQFNVVVIEVGWVKKGDLLCIDYLFD